MKKIIAMLLALVMVLGLADCASKTEPAQPEGNTPAESTDTPATDETAPAETATEEPAATEATGSVYYPVSYTHLSARDEGSLTHECAGGDSGTA